VTTFYSPRKFFGVPDGGYLVPEPFPLPTMLDDTTTASRMAHLFRRLSGDVRGGYSDFLAAEASFDEPGIRGMSPFTFNLLKRIDYGDVASRRRTNFAFLHAHFRERNGFAALVEGAGDAVPLCYPLLLDKPADAVRSRLSEADIFIPLYWPELRAILPVDAIAERTWVANVLPLPCDQRYTPKMLERMVATVDAALG
jgi:hypothetical protein